jgi:methionyl-tRNA formyltransferase
MSIIFIATPDFAVPSLQILAQTGHEISAVITQPDRPAGRGRKPRISPVKEEAVRLGIPVLQPPSLRDAPVIDEIRALSPEVMVAVAYGQILRRDFLAIAPRGVLNVHPSLLPKYRGASPIQSAILAGDEATGVTIMLMDEGMDSGPILAQESVEIADSDTGGSLSATLSHLGGRLLGDTLPGWLDGTIAARPQNEEAATTTRLLKKEDGRIDWRQPAEQIWRQVRAYDPWPGSFTTFGGERLNILRVHALKDGGAAGPGVVVEVGGADGEPGLAVGTGGGLLVLEEVQREGRRRMSALEFARGAKGIIGGTLK